MTAFRVGSIVHDLSTPNDHWIVIGYREEDDTVMISDMLGDRLMRLDASYPGLVYTAQWDADEATAYRQTLRNHLLDHVGRHSMPVAEMVSMQLDHLGEVLPL